MIWRRFLPVLLLVVPVLAALNGGAVQANDQTIPSHSAAAITGWPTGAAMLGMACAGVNVCFAIGVSVKPPIGVIAHTVDGGTSWTIRTDPQSIFNSIACPSPTQCYVMTGHNHAHGATFAVTVTLDGGKTWQQRPLPAGTQPTEMACPGVTTCVLWGNAAVGASPPKVAILITRNGGRTWKAGRTVGQRLTGTSTELVCPTSRVCYAYYGGFGSNSTAIIKTRDGGVTWRALRGTNMFALSGVPPHTLVNMGGIACPSARVCYTAQGDARCQCDAWGPYGTVFGTRDGGKHWGQLYRASGRNYPTGSIACPSVSVCYAVGASQRDVPADQIILSTKDGGRTWTPQGLPAGPILACPSSTICYAATHAGAAFRTTNGGTTWQALP